MSRIATLAAAGAAALGALGCQPADSRSEANDARVEAPARIAEGPHDVAVIELGALGVIRFELLPEIAPKGVALFERIASEGLYDGTYFHRVIPGFMIQGGDPNTKNNDPRDDGKGGTANIEDEFSSYPHVRGTVALANTGYRNSGGSQFFIVHQDSRHLDGSYSAFGRVIEGMDVVDAITELEIDTYGRYGPPNRPYPKSAVVHKLRIERAPGSSATATLDPPEPSG